MKILNLAVWMTTLVAAAILFSPGCSKKKPPTESKPVLAEANEKAPVLIEPNAGVDQVRKGMNQQQVEALLGKPGSKHGPAWFYTRQGMFVSFGDNGVLFNIKCLSPFAGVTKEGIGIGATRAEVIAAYGNPDQDQHFDHGDENLWFAPLRTSFYLEKDRVTSFIVHL